MIAWQVALPTRAARVYVAAVVLVGATGVALWFPLKFELPELSALVLLVACVTSTWKVSLPIPLASSSTLSVSYAANLMALLLLGPRQAMLIAVAGAWTQCLVNVKQSYPLYRTAFSTAAVAITMIATGLTYGALGGSRGPFTLAALPKPLVGAIVTYFVVNTGLVAAAIGLTTGRSPIAVWRDEFLWSGASFFIAGSAGAAAAVVIERGEHWLATLLFAPVYLTYWTYQVFVGRLEDQKRDRERLAVALADMTRLKEVRNRLLEREQIARTSAEQANRVKDQFLAIVSHELRTPLNAMLGWSDMLRTGALDARRRTRAIQSIHDSARQQARLIEELLDVSRIISGKLSLERSAVDWPDIVRRAVEVVQPAALAKHIDIHLHLDRHIGPFSGDDARLQQVVSNLVTNAVKFTPDGGAVDVQLGHADGIVELSVTDTGEGIPAEFLPSVFEPFRQADGSITRRHGGLGLGLSIVKHLVDAHGGTIAVASEGQGRGSTFTVRLPRSPVYSEGGVAVDGEQCVTRPRQPSTSLEGIRVLVVDDDDGSRDVVAAYLESRLAAVRSAASAGEAIEILCREPMDVLLADIAMPGHDGYALIRTVRAMANTATAGIPAAALTAFARADDRREALEAGFQLHLTKPIAADVLIDAVASLHRINQAAERSLANA